jgi:hypothetical protein
MLLIVKGYGGNYVLGKAVRSRCTLSIARKENFELKPSGIPRLAAPVAGVLASRSDPAVRLAIAGRGRGR